MVELELSSAVRWKLFWRAFHGLTIALMLLGLGEGRLGAQFSPDDDIAQISGVKPVGKDQRSDEDLVATGFHALSEKEQALVAQLKTAKVLNGMPWNPVTKQLLRSQSGKYYLLRMGEDGVTFGIWKCVRTGKRYSVPWATENDPYVGCFHVDAGAAVKADGKPQGKEPAAGLHLMIHIDPAGVPFEKLRRTFCDLRDDSPAMKELLEKLWTQHGERYAGREVSYHGPDHPAVVISFEKNGRRFVLTSWHPTYRKNPKAVMTASGGITWGDTEKERRKVIDERPAELRQFVTDFDAILDAAEKLGKPFDF